LISAEQLELALAEKEETGHRLGEIVLQHGWVVAATLARLLAEQHALEYVDLPHTTIDPAAASLLPEKLARRYEALPVRFLADNLVLVAVGDPTNVVASDDLRLALGLNVRLAVAALPDLENAITSVHRAQISATVIAADEELGLEDIRGTPPRLPRSRWSTRSSPARSTRARPTSTSSRRRRSWPSASASTASRAISPPCRRTCSPR